MNLRIALVYGGTSGIGKNIVKKLVKNNFLVYSFGISCKNGQKGSVIYRRIDLSDTKRILKELIDIYDKHRKIELIVYNARARSKFNFLEEDVCSFQTGIDIMLKAPFFICQTLARQKNRNKEKTTSSIVVISSIAGRYVGDAPPSYHFSKAGINNMIKYISSQTKGLNIKINAILPSLIVKDEYIDMFESKNNSKYRNIVKNTYPLKNIGLSDDVANAVLFLSSDKSMFVNGEIIGLDGGICTQEQVELTFKTRLCE